MVSNTHSMRTHSSEDNRYLVGVGRVSVAPAFYGPIYIRNRV